VVRYYLIKHNGKSYKVKAECENAAIAKLRLCLNNKDQKVFSTNISDGVEDVAKILGGIAVAALEKKKMLQSKNPTVVEGAVKTLGVLGADILAAGAELANLAKRNLV